MVGTFTVEPVLAPDDADWAAPFAPEERLPSPPIPRPRLRLPPRTGRRRRAAASILPEAPALFPWLARGLAPGEATLWCGARAAVDPILEMLYAGSALARGRISLLEGANRFHPYRIGELGRSLGLGADETLERIRLARAFTAHQMVALVDGWAREARRHPPTILVGHDLPTLFWDGETPPDERDALLRHVARTLADLLASVDVPLLLTFGPDGPARFVGLDDGGPRWADLVRFERGPTTLRARALRSDARLALVPRAAGQRGIEEFGEPAPAEEVIGWDAPCRRTARRSRSG
ncbi:MAG TPA: hypothetical protein VML53_05770 [Thermoplasmata archaeon]|nr:hypothetical protein [Thermoplasmata archaeon]